MFFIRTYLILSSILLFASCSSNPGNKGRNINYDSLREPLVNANKLSVKRESDEIDQYVKFKGLDMIVTGTGLRYMIYKQGAGPIAKTGQVARISYKVSLLDGKICYTSEKNGIKQFTIGSDPVESGLHEALLYMHAGDRALLVLPSHLAFGLTGDGDKIPARASVAYDIELVSLH